MQAFRDNLRLVALVVAIALGWSAQSAAVAEVGLGPFAQCGGEELHGMASPVTLENFAPQLG